MYFFKLIYQVFLCKTPVFCFLINQLIMPAKCKRNSIHFEIITYHIHSCYQDSTLTPCGYNTEDARSSHMEPTHSYAYANMRSTLCLYTVYGFYSSRRCKMVHFVHSLEACVLVWMTFCSKRV